MNKTPRYTFPSTREQCTCNSRFRDIASAGSSVVVLQGIDDFTDTIVTTAVIRIRSTDVNSYVKVWVDLGGEIQGLTGSGASSTNVSSAVQEALDGMQIIDSNHGTDIDYKRLAADLAEHRGLISPTVLDLR